MVPISEQGAKYAELEYKVLEERQGLSLVEVKIVTGRSHQIRVQLANLKHPLVGDKKYGSKIDCSNLALWAYALDFEHPTKKTHMKFRALPQEAEMPWNCFDLKRYV